MPGPRGAKRVCIWKSKVSRECVTYFRCINFYASKIFQLHRRRVYWIWHCLYFVSIFFFISLVWYDTYYLPGRLVLFNVKNNLMKTLSAFPTWHILNNRPASLFLFSLSGVTVRQTITVHYKTLTPPPFVCVCVWNNVYNYVFFSLSLTLFINF